MSHYYDFDPSLQSKPKQINAYIGNEKLSFLTDIGVFSKNEIDFGSYLLILELLKQPSVETLLDVGCGYGVIGLTLSYFKKCQQVDLIDVNPRAIELTLKNAKNFHLSNAEVYLSDGFTNVKKIFDTIVMNPPIRAGKKVIYSMFLDAFYHLKHQGELWIVIKKDLGALSAQKKLLEIFKQVRVVLKHKGYWILQATKENCESE